MIKVYNPNSSVVTYKEESSGRTYNIQPFSWGFVPEEAAGYFMMAPGVDVVIPELEKTKPAVESDRDITPPETGEADEGSEGGDEGGEPDTSDDDDDDLGVDKYNSDEEEELFEGDELNELEGI